MSFVVTAGELKAVQRSPVVYQSAPIGAVDVAYNVTLTYEQLWRAQPALRTVVDFLARNVAQLGLDVFQKVTAGDRVRLPDHPVTQLLERPMSGTKWTKYRLLNTVMHDLCIYDDAYILKLRLGDGGPARGLLPISPRLITPTGENPFIAESYLVTGNRGRVEVKADDVIHIHGWNGSDPRRGFSPIETLRQILAEEYAATTYREQLWRNGARVPGYIKRPKDAPRWSEPARERFESSWRSLYSGDNATGGTPILEDGMDFVGAGITPKEAQYVESRKLTREECAVAYHIAPTMVGLMDGATFSNITEQHKMLYQDTLAPYLVQLSQDLENQLLADVDPSSVDGATYIEFNLGEKLRGSFTEQAQAMQTAVGAPWMTRTEARSRFNLPHIDGADELIVPLNVITGGLASPNDTAPDQPNNGKSRGDVLRAFYARQREVLLSKVHSTGGLRFDAPRWDRELSVDLWGAPGVGDAAIYAKGVNATTEQRLRDALADQDAASAIKHVFAELIEELDR